jgi:hypothetical protein
VPAVPLDAFAMQLQFAVSQWASWMMSQALPSQ